MKRDIEAGDVYNVKTACISDPRLVTYSFMHAALCDMK